MTTATQPRLTAEQVASYRREGYLTYREPVLPVDEFAALSEHFDDILAKLPAGSRPEHMDVPHFTNPTLFRWLLHDAVLDLVEPLLGPDIALFSSHFICKPKGDGRRVPWHEDSSYWRGQMDPMEVVTVWLAIDPSLPSNGCMRVIPSTHDNGYSEYGPVDPTTNVFPTEIRKELFDAKRAVDIVLQPNQCSLHDGRLMHGSNANTSDQRRCGYTMRYISTRTRWNHEQFGEWHQLYLARGVDHAGNRYGNPGTVYRNMLTARGGAKVKVGH